ncbi:MAG: hypothetical protein EBZ75_15800, partial [Oxalobacteraceae bacterium]|nr:hypothetical protein [Oxalobacteraceae bacterium]
PQAIYNRAHEIPQSFMDSLKHDAEKTDIILRARGSDKWHQKAHNLMDDVAEGVFQKNDRPLLIMRPQAPKGVTPEQYQAALNKMLPHMQGPYAFGSANAAGAANVFLPKVNLGGNRGPNYFDLAKQVGPDKAVQQMCTGSNAHHCGSMPAEMLKRLGQRASGIWSKLYLPNFLALEKGMAPVAVVGKSRMLSDLSRMSKYRGAFGLGAAALTGGLGYLGTGAVQNAMRGPKLPPKPQLDPAMFSKAMTLLKPQQR